MLASVGFYVKKFVGKNDLNYRIESYKSVPARNNDQDNCFIQELAPADENDILNNLITHKHILLKGIVYSIGERKIDWSNWQLVIHEINNTLLLYGVEGLKLLKGNFSISFFDEKTKRIFFYRSLTGTGSTIYYRKKDNIIEFSTHPFRIISKTKRSINKEILGSVILNVSTKEDSSVYQNILRLPCGYLATIEDNRIIINKLKDFVIEPRSYERDEPVFLQRLILDRAKMLMSDQLRIGVQFSGGLDSSVVLTAIKEHTNHVKAYHWSSKEFPPADESQYAYETSEKLNVELHSIEVGRSFFKGKSYLDSNWNFAIPYPHSFYKYYCETVDQMKKDNCNIFTSGHLGDTLFGIWNDNLVLHDVFKNNRLKNSIDFLWELAGSDLKLKPILKSLFNSLGKDVEGKLKFNFYKKGASLLTNDAIESAIRNRNNYFEKSLDFTYRSNVMAYHMIHESINHEDGTSLDLNLFRPNGIYLVNLLENEEIINYALSMHPLHKNVIQGGQIISKPLLRKSFNKQLPSSVIKRNYRSNWFAIGEQYMIENSDFLGELLSEGYLVKERIIDKKKLLDILQQPKKYSRVCSLIIQAAMIEIWIHSLQ